jgi:hypothetical protein
MTLVSAPGGFGKTTVTIVVRYASSGRFAFPPEGRSGKPFEENGQD